MSTRTRLIVLAATVPIVAFTLVGGFLGRAVAREDTYRHLRIFEDVASLISNNYVEPVDLDDVMEGALRGLSNGLDADSAYLLEVDVERIQAGRALPAGRVGVDVTQQFYVQIVATRDGSPAARAGLQPGDYIRAIDGQPTRQMSAIEGTRLLRGEAGSTVTLSLLRGNTQEPYDIVVVREVLAGPTVTSRLLESGTEGYLRVSHFDDGVGDEIESAVAALRAEGATRFLVDIRSAGGGSIDAGIEAARRFIPSGTILRRAEHGQEGDATLPIDSATGDDAIDERLVLLANFGTSDAAEVFAAALVGAGRAETVGQRTSGRASLQKLVRLPDGTGLWMSYARYLKASGDPIHRYGVEPTVAVDVPTVELGEPLPPGDPIFDEALAHLRATAL